MNRRLFVSTALAALGLGKAARAESFEFNLTDEEWRARLSPEAYQVLRHEATERAGCDLPLFSSTTKYDSGTGWPSFWQPLDNAIRTRADPGIFGDRVEVHCRRCGGHLGHVFEDGPQPTGLRYCMNGVSLAFVPG
jgi:peptide-methionine (R)-S-oxide reductase